MKKLNGFQVYDFLMKGVNENLTASAATQQEDLTTKSEEGLYEISFQEFLDEMKDFFKREGIAERHEAVTAFVFPRPVESFFRLSFMIKTRNGGVSIEMELSEDYYDKTRVGFEVSQVTANSRILSMSSGGFYRGFISKDFTQRFVQWNDTQRFFKEVVDEYTFDKRKPIPLKYVKALQTYIRDLVKKVKADRFTEFIKLGEIIGQENYPSTARKNQLVDMFLGLRDATVGE